MISTNPRPAAPRYPTIARVCFHLNWSFVVLWLVYLAGPDATGLFGLQREGAPYRWFAGTFFLFHFVLMSTAIIALFVVIIEIYSRRPVQGFRGVLLALALPMLSFLYFATRFLAEVHRWLDA